MSITQAFQLIHNNIYFNVQFSDENNEEREAVWFKVLYSLKFSHFSSPTHDIEIGKSFNYIA